MIILILGGVVLLAVLLFGAFMLGMRVGVEAGHWERIRGVSDEVQGS